MVGSECDYLREDGPPLLPIGGGVRGGLRSRSGVEQSHEIQRPQHGGTPLIFENVSLKLKNCDEFFTFYCGIEQLPPANSVSNFLFQKLHHPTWSTEQEGILLSFVGRPAPDLELFRFCIIQ